jgi:hypothetical protein
MKKLMAKEEFIKICHTELKHNYKIQSGQYIKEQILNTLISLASSKLTIMEQNLKEHYKMILASNDEDEKEIWIDHFYRDLKYYRKLREELKDYIIESK